MILGVDAGGTNFDAVAVDDEGVIDSAKEPSEEGDLAEVVSSVVDGRPVDRVVVSTTRVLNAAVQGELADCTNVLVPGVGLSPELAYAGDENLTADGCIDHRGRVTESLSLEGVEPSNEAVAVNAKFSTRNPSLELEASEEFDAETIALGHEAGGRLGFPKRAETTVANAKSATVFKGFESSVDEALREAGIDAPTYYLKGDAAMLSDDSARTAPAQTLRSGPASSALGLIALSGVENGICIDIGGTTTDVVAVDDGFPVLEDEVGAGDLSTFYEGVVSVDAVVGGDTCVDEDGLTGRRDGVAATFGGPSPTPTDAFVVLEEIKDGEADTVSAREAISSLSSDEQPEEIAERVVEGFIDEVVRAVESLREEATYPEEETTVVLGGEIAETVVGRLEDSLGWAEEVVVPEHADVCGAVGCAVSHVSVRTHVHIDTARGEMAVSSVGPEKVQEVEHGRNHDDEELDALAREEAAEAARRAGASAIEATADNSEVISSRSFNVVENGRVVGQIADVEAQVKPGLRWLE